ncbi:hypothetical protein SMSP2_02833 [Limihaloglobus sulfuriphilus]|uniref:Uncharacterized protein n=1 Tax=Limihaloglobus sulfuriphilus TaxID=1851148 RepID=A0A1Q2MIV2_9BACT|nr:hypothetical protein [Limihaloglobus sulfuriphilus]AQQ72448.1 hypothetical protein SMSP2_02833 [Limihaloglobus sulfuriphilus]
MLKHITYPILVISLSLLFGCAAGRPLPVEHERDGEPVTLEELADPSAAELEPRAEAVLLEFTFRGRDTELLWAVQKVLKPLETSEIQTELFKHNCLSAGRGDSGQLEKLLAVLDSAGARLSKRTNILLFDEDGLAAPIKTCSTEEYINYTDQNGERVQLRLQNAVLEWYISVTAAEAQSLKYSIIPRIRKPQSLIEKRYKIAENTRFDWAGIEGLAQSGGFVVLSPCHWPVAYDDLAEHIFSAGDSQSLRIFCFVFTKVSQ